VVPDPPGGDGVPADDPGRVVVDVDVVDMEVEAGPGVEVMDVAGSDGSVVLGRWLLEHPAAGTIRRIPITTTIRNAEDLRAWPARRAHTGMLGGSRWVPPLLPEFAAPMGRRIA
jgi:hypothetical protein